MLKREVHAAHDAWASAAARWGDNNLTTLRLLARYYDARSAWETHTGRTYDRSRRGRS